jgi:tryptophan halogenase
VDIQPQAATLAYLQSIESVIERCVEVMPSHADFIAKHCRAAPLPA